MKKYYITILLALVALTGWAQVNSTTALLGSWSGKLNVGAVSLTLVLHLEQTDGYVTASLDSPDQGAKGIPAYKEFLSDDSLALKVQQIGMTYRARLKNNKLDGTFTQNGMSLPLVMTKGVAEAKRPQTPKEPYPYATEEVMFRNTTDLATLVGTLTWPVDYDKNAKQKPTVVLMVTGSGQQNRDEELMQHKPFLVIAATRCPVFALNGDRDCQVISSLNLTAIERLLPKSKHNLIKEYPGLNHLFQHCTTGLVAEYSQIEETISPEVLSDIVHWINSLK